MKNSDDSKLIIRGGDKLTVVFICSTIFLAVLLVIIWHREGYASKIKQKLGIEEDVREDWRTYLAGMQA